MNLDLAVIGGTGLYRFPGLENIEKRTVDTPFGATSAEIMLGDFRDKHVAFLARHGENHTIAPHRVNYRANLWALHQLGAHRVIGINAVGGIRVDMGPRVIVLPDQIVDYTHGRFTSFCDVEGAEVKHIDFSEPYSLSLRQALVLAASNADISVVPDGVYGATQGPRLETRAEIARMRIDGCDVVGMTGMPEAALARELELDYACIALVVNWAGGCGDQAEITLSEIFANLEVATAQLPSLIAALLAL